MNPPRRPARRIRGQSRSGRIQRPTALERLSERLGRSDNGSNAELIRQLGRVLFGDDWNDPNPEPGPATAGERQ
jgi:hypothetical protein